MKHAVLCFRTGEPDFSDLPDNENDCDNTAYGRVHKEIPDDKPELLIVPSYYFWQVCDRDSTSC